MTTPLKLLFVEDSEDDVQLALRMLRKGDFAPQHVRVDTREAMTAALDQQEWDVIISDYAMPRFNGIDALLLYKQRKMDIPFILISGTVGEEPAVAMMRAGAHDYITKDNMIRLAPAIDRELRELRLRRERKQDAEKLAYHAYLLDSVSNAVMATDFDLILTAWNRASEKIYGWTEEEVLGRPLFDVLPTKFSHQERDLILHRLATQTAVSGESLQTCKDGHQVWVEFTMSALRAADGQINGYVAVNRDVSERKKNQLELQQLNRSLRMLTESNQLLVRAVNEDALVRDICTIVCSFGGYSAAWVAYVDADDPAVLHPKAHAGFSPDSSLVADLPFLINDLASCAVQDAVRQRQPMICSRVLTDACMECSHEVTKNPHGGCVSLPLLYETELLGVLNVYSDQVANFPLDELVLLQELAGDVAYGLHMLRVEQDRRHTSRLLERSHIELAGAYNATIAGWSKALELREKETAGHSQRVVHMTVQMAEQMGFHGEALEHVRRGALLHDIGKMGIPDHVLLKPGPLNDDEWILMRQHPQYAVDLLEGIDYLKPALAIPFCHHEHWDGSGYPRGLKGEEIPLEARIFAVIDVWDALLAKRPYRPAWSMTSVKFHIRSQSGQHFDPQVVEAFLKLVEANEEKEKNAA